MSGTLFLRITSPLAVVVEQPVSSLRVSDASGCFGILRGHADFSTRLAISVVVWMTPEGAWCLCAVRGGALTARRGTVAIATRKAVVGDDLEQLDRDVLVRFRADLDEEPVERVETTRLRLDVMRGMLSRLQPEQQRSAG